MPISLNGGANPTSITYGGKNVTEVYCDNQKIWPPTPKYAHLVQNHWPKCYETAHLDHNPRWIPAIEIRSTENPNSQYFTSANIANGGGVIPFTCKIFPEIKSQTYQLDYWTMTAPDGTVQRFDDTDAHVITFDQEGDWIENSYWKTAPSQLTISLANNRGSSYDYGASILQASD